MAIPVAHISQDPPGKSALMAVLFADLVGFTKHMARDERRTLSFLEQRMHEARAGIEKRGGWLVKSTGDGFFAVFPTATKALKFAVDFQPDEARSDAFAFRIGIHSGEVRLADDDVFGHAVNVAARIEGFAPDHGICISHDVFSLVRHAERFQFESIGAQRLKNVAGQHMLYTVSDANRQTSLSPVGVVGVETVGGLRLTGSTGRSTLPKSKEACAILACLALSPGQAEGVLRLNSILGLPGREDTDAAILDLQDALGSAVDLSGGVLRLKPDQVRIDLIEAEQKLKQGELTEFLSRDRLWPEHLLAGMDEISAQFAAWLEVARSEWKERFAILLETELGRFEENEPGTRDLATALLIIEDAHEQAARRLIRFHVAVGNPGAAQRVYDQIARILGDRYGITPRPETLAALQSQNLPAPSRPRRGVAVVPLRLQVHDLKAEGDVLRDRFSGFRSELLAGLACFRGWSVVEGVQNSDQGEEVSDYAVTLEATEAMGPGVINLGLIEIATGRLVWKDSFDIGAGGFDVARRQVVGRIAATLEVFITTDRTVVSESETRHEIIDDWLRGERLIARWTPEAHDEASDIFSAILAQAPTFAPAYASLASILNVKHVVRPGIARDAETSRRAHSLANQALELDPLDARNQLVVAWSAALDGAFDKASVNFDMATRLNPHSPRTLMSCAMGFGFLGEHGRAAEILAHSIECAPVLLDYQWCYAASVHLLAGNGEAALEAAERSGDKIIDNPGWTAAALVKLGRRSEASVALSRLVREVSDNWCGPQDPTPQLVRDWFVSAYPLRNESDRQMLQDALSEAVQGLNYPLEGL